MAVYSHFFVMIQNAGGILPPAELFFIYFSTSGIAESIDRYLPRDLVLDLTQLGFMGSSGIAVIVRSYKKMRDAGGRMYIENPQPQPLKVLDASGIDRMIPIAAKREVTT